MPPLCPRPSPDPHIPVLHPHPQVQQQASELTNAAANMPFRIRRIDSLLEQLESGDIKLRVRGG